MLYFLADVSQQELSPERLAALGLTYVSEQGRLRIRGVTRGPEGHNGIVFSAVSEAREGWATSALAYHPERQDWMPCCGRDNLWLGWPKGLPPGPEELARTQQIGGHPVVLGDGRTWRVPVARLLTGGSPLPSSLRWDGGRWAPGEILEQYRELFAQACQWWDQLQAAAQAEGDGSSLVTLTVDDEADLVVRALAVNYRLGPAEVSALGLLTSETLYEVIMALCDVPSLERLKKKRASTSGSCGASPAGPSPATAPVSPS